MKEKTTARIVNMKYIVAKLIAIFLGFKIAFIVLNDIGLIPNPFFVVSVTILATTLGYLSCKFFYNGLLSVFEDHRPSEEQDRDPIL